LECLIPKLKTKTQKDGNTFIAIFFCVL
jgi:hypothetical protein